MDRSFAYDVAKGGLATPVDAIKLQNFLRENPRTEFPQFRSLDSADCAHLRVVLAQRLGFDVQSEPLVLLNSLHSTAKFIPNIDAQNGLDLRSLVSDLGVEPRRNVLVNWYRFDQIDALALSDLTEHFESIWYPGPDDIEIFDESLDWFVVVRHDGRVSIIRLPT